MKIVKSIFFAAMLIANSSFAVDRILTADPSKPNSTKTTFITVTNNQVITSTNCITKDAVQGITQSAGASDAGKIPKIGPIGTLDTSVMGTGASSNAVLVAVSPSNAVWSSTVSSPIPSLAFAFTNSAPTSGNWTNTLGDAKVLVQCWGGGGSGNSGANQGGGGAGGFCEKTFSVTNGQISAYTRGTGAPANSGLNGGSTTITINGITLTANGGNAGGASSAGAGGTASGGDISIRGGAGGRINGTGGSSPRGGGAGDFNAGSTSDPGGGGNGGNGDGGAGWILIYH